MTTVTTPLRQCAPLLLCALALAGCANFSGIAPTTQQLRAADLGLQTSAAVPAPQIASAWWRAYGDAQLTELVEAAIANNPSLQVARARIERVKAVNEVVDAALLPSVGAGLDMTRQLFTSTGMYPPPLAGTVRETATLQASASWELDFFGKNRAALDAALGQMQAAQADAQAARMLLASSVARSYFQLLRLQAQSELVQATLAQRDQIRRLVQERVQAGLDTQFELRQSEGALPDTRLQLEMLAEQMQLTRNALAALTARPGAAIARVLPAQSAIQLMAIRPVLPIDLLARRADIAAAAQRVKAALSDVDNAKAQFYPNINLVAFAGMSSIGFDRLMDAGSQQWGIGPAVRLPLFDGGRLRANLRAKTTDLDAAIASYNAAVLDAVRDVADQIASTQALARQQTEQAQAQAKAQAGYEIAQQRFQAGLGTALHVLAAQTAVLAQQRQAQDLLWRTLDTQVQLVRSLGGGYQEEALAAAP
ncbi:MAG: efflux transporter outer membrane subunit [Burkholderiales bacterium]